MVNISTYTSLLNQRFASSSTAAPIQSREVRLGASVDVVTESTVSILARQLSEAAARAETRNAGTLDSILGDNYFARRAQHDAEVPDTDSQELIARAKQATDFLNGSDSNPFKGLARDQLNLIAHDDSGSFTINERRAAWEETNNLSRLNEQTASTISPVPGSGRDLMIARLFLGVEPEVANGVRGMSRADMGRSPYEFLTRDDRELLSQMYAYAQGEGADLTYVDRLASRLGDYRQHDNGRTLGSANNGKSYNAEGYMITVDFKEKDAAIASRLLSGTAINSTRLDPNFLRHILDPGYGALSNYDGLAFLEQMVIKFSNEAVTQPSLSNEFAKYTSIDSNDNVVITVHKGNKLPPFEPLATNIDGVWGITEKGRAAGYRMDPLTGQPRLVAPLVGQHHSRLFVENRAGQTHKSVILEALSGNRDQPDTRPVRLSSLFRLLQNDRP